MNRFSLRTRLVAVAVALVAVAVVATGVATYAALRGFLYSRLDDQVRSAANRPPPVCALFQDTGGGAYDGPGGGPGLAVWVGKLDASGNPLAIECTRGQLIGTFLSPTA